MNLAALVRRNARHYFRTHLAATIGVALCSSILTGALLVGDSVRFSLRDMARQRLANVQFAVLAPGRFFRAAWAGRLQEKLDTTVAPVMILDGSVSEPTSGRRLNQVQVLGVNTQFWQLGYGPPAVEPRQQTVVINDVLAKRMAVEVGDELLLRIANPSSLSRDAALVSLNDGTRSLRVTVGGVVDAAGFGHFGLRAAQLAPSTVFVSLPVLAGRIERPLQANALLMSGDQPAATITQALKKTWRLEDAELTVRSLPDLGIAELRSRRVFLPPRIGELAAADDTDAVLTYVANELHANGQSTPYSMVTALAPGTALSKPILPGTLKDDEIAVNEWLADDLDIAAGDQLRMSYYVLGEQRELLERQQQFIVRHIVPMAAIDRELMPDFPGLSDADHCRDWDSGMPIDFTRIRNRDEAYWDRYRGTPKAFITLAKGQALWHNRYGNSTALRFQASDDGISAVRERIRDALDPAEFGYVVRDVGAGASAAVTEAMDLGGLFIGFGFFLVVATLIILGLLTAFSLEQRAAGRGALLTMGWDRRRIEKMYLLELGPMMLAGGVLGMVGGVLYTQLVLRGLVTIWQDAIAGLPVRFHMTAPSLLTGAMAAVILSYIIVFWTLRRQRRVSAVALMRGESTSDLTAKNAPKTTACAIASAVAAALCLGGAHGADVAMRPAWGFASGGLFMAAGLATFHVMLRRLSTWSFAGSLRGLAVSNLARRRQRSLGIAGVLAAAVFMMVAVGANRRPTDVPKGPGALTSGTGGFALIGNSTQPVHGDLNTDAAKDEFGWPPGVKSIVAFRVHAGDDASCLNLNRAQRPQIVGVETAALTGRFQLKGAGSARVDWSILSEPDDQGRIPAVVDENTMMWGLGLRLGDELVIRDGLGQETRLVLAAALARSALQGQVLISDTSFQQLFPDESGNRFFLVDADGETPETASAMMQAMRDFGLELEPVSDRLRRFNGVENSYLAVFQALGLLGLLLGSAGLAVLILRTALERRRELAVLTALGFGRGQLMRLLFMEHAALLVVGLLCGAVAAVAAVWPSLRVSEVSDAFVAASWSMVLILANGILWIALAAKLSMRDRLLPALNGDG